MLTTSPTAAAIDLLENHTGVVIPVYLRPDADPTGALAILRDTVHMFMREVKRPQSICLSVDGPGPAEEVARRLVDAYGVRLVVAARNRGKLAALGYGMELLLEDPGLRYFAAVDQDGDHFGNELLNFIRAAEHSAQHTGSDNLLVLGSRLTRHRPLGFLRAEQEELANRILLDALAYDAAVTGTPLSLHYLTTRDPLPDFHSGYKLLSRSAAAAIFTQKPDTAGCGDDAYYRHAVEAVMVVETHKRGGLLVSVNRRTFDEQPISVFASLNRARVAADMILWPCKRLRVPGPFVAQWLTNHLPTLLVGTLTPQGRDEILAVRDLVLTGYDLYNPAQISNQIARPRFV